MMTRTQWCRWLMLLTLAMPASAMAQAAFTTQDVNVRAGPARDYPLVAWLPPGTQVTVAGCLSDWKWCDVIVGRNRGWVYARFLAYPYQNQRLPIYGSGAMFGLPIVTFSIVNYWDNYYRGRPWYSNRPNWQHRPPPPNYRPPPPRPPPPPSVRPPPRPAPQPSPKPPGIYPPAQPKPMPSPRPSPKPPGIYPPPQPRSTSSPRPSVQPAQ